MARTGRPPKPTALKLLTGNPGKRKLNASEPQPAKAAPGTRRVPSSLPPVGRALWKKLVPELERLGLLTSVDDGALHGLCLNYARAIQAAGLVRKQGPVIVTDKGFVLPHPAVAMERNAWKAYKEFCSLFGLDPSSRTRLHVDVPTDTAESDEDFLFGKKPA